MRWKNLAAWVAVALFAGAVFVSAADLVRVRSLLEDGRPGEALADLEEHLENDPVDPKAMFLRGLLLAETERTKEAREVFEQVSGLRPDRPEPLNNVAVIQAAMGDYDAAVETLKEALRTHPAYRTAYENLTKIYGQLASEAYSRALSVDQAHDRSALELVLLSEMPLPESQPLEEAPAPAEPLPSATTMVAEAEMEAGEEEAEPPVQVAAVDTDGVAAEAGEGLESGDEMVETAEAQTAGMVSEPASEPKSMDPAASGREDADLEARLAVVSNTPPASPEEAIEEVLSQGREDLAKPASESPVPEPMPSRSEQVEGAEEAAEGTEPVPDLAEPAELAALVEAWAQAWSDQRVDDYLSFYANSFEPAGEMSRADWDDLRRQRVSQPEFVRVSVAFLDFEADQPGRALVRFNQSYESDTFSDLVTKTLEFKRDRGAWKIVRETVES